MYSLRWIMSFASIAYRVLVWVGYLLINDVLCNLAVTSHSNSWIEDEQSAYQLLMTNDLGSDIPNFYHEVSNISVFLHSVSRTSRLVCSNLPDKFDHKACMQFIAQDLRIRRIFRLQNIYTQIQGAMQPSLQPLLEKEQFSTFRRRDHELLALMRHFDNWDVQESEAKQINNRKNVCMIGPDPRIHFLLVFLSFKTVSEVTYFVQPGTSLSVTNEWRVSADVLNNVVAQFSGKSVQLMDLRQLESDWKFYESNCAVFVLPSDEDALKYGSETLTSVFGTLSNKNSQLSLANRRDRVPIIWVSDNVHGNIYPSPTQFLSILLQPYLKYFDWHLQSTWNPLSIVMPVGIDAEGIPRSYYFPSGSQHHADPLFSTLYIGHAKPLNTISSIYSSCVNCQPSESSNMVILISYDDRVYAETARGLKQQLQDELHYPHVLIVPHLTWEMLSVLDEYLLDVSLAEQQTDEVQCEHVSCSARVPRSESHRELPTMHVVQILLTPHYPASRLVSSQRYALKAEDGERVVRMVQYSYVMVHMEQTWFYESYTRQFPAGAMFLHDARSIWTYSKHLGEALSNLYRSQLKLEHSFIDESGKSVSTDEFSRQGKLLEEKLMIDIVPVFAPCLPHMPCHQHFASSHARPVPVAQYELLFMGHCSPYRSTFLQSLFTELSSSSLIQFQPPCVVGSSGPKAVMSLVGELRDRTMLQRSTILLNIAQFLPGETVLEMHRLMYLLSMGKCVVSQRGRDPSLSSLSVLRGAVHFVDSVQDVVHTLQHLLTPTDFAEAEAEAAAKGVNDDEEEQELERQQEDAVRWRWLQQSHGSFGRLAHCEKRSLLAYRRLHQLQFPRNGRRQETYGTAQLAQAMDILQHRLRSLEPEQK